MKLIINIFLLHLSFCSSMIAKRIGIVGGGIGGTASAYFLHQLLHTDECHIDVFEPRDLGGRLRVITLGKHQYEAGGSVIHPRNALMQRFVQDLGLKHRKTPSSGKLGLYDGKDFVFKESDYGWITKLKLLWRYGTSLFTMNSITKKRLDMFSKIYSYHDKGICFKSTKEILNAMSDTFPKSTQTAAKTGFYDQGMTEPLVGELIGATLRVNYGQTMNKAHEFVGFVSVAGSEGDLWAVQDGNYQVPKRLFNSSHANLIPSAVRKIAALDSGEYQLFWRDENSNLENATYDVIILATPITDELPEYHKIDLPELKNPIPVRHLHHLVVTFVRGAINYTTFGGDTSITEVISINEDPWFNSLSLIYPVDGSIPDASEQPVFKVFSSNPLTSEQYDLLFSKRVETLPLKWYAYPHYSYIEPLEGHFILRDGLFYLNDIEWAASAMEMSAISAKNIALLIRNYLHPELEVSINYVSNGIDKNEL